MTDLNLVGESYAHSLIAAGHVDKTSAWSFSTEDGNALLGSAGNDWESYAKVHLGIDRAANDKTKGRYKYPVAKGGKLYRSGLISARARAGQQNDSAILKAAGVLVDLIDKPQSRSARLGIDSKISPFEYKFVDGSAEGTFDGYGSVFNHMDDYGDEILPGAFSKTLAQAKTAGKMPIMLLNHGGLPWGGQTAESLLPVGGWDTLSEDTKGLYGRGHLINLDTESGKRLYGAMKDKQINGMSITYVARDFKRGAKASDPRRSISNLDLIELGPVTFPANAMATINSVASAQSSLTTIREFEDFLRDVGRFSNAAAKAIAASGFKANIPEPRDEDGIGEAIAGPFAALAKLIRSK